MLIRLISSAGIVGASLAKDAAGLGPRLSKVVRHHGRLAQTRVKARASGRPGPNAPTGDYRRSIDYRMVSSAGGIFVAAVGTNSPQGRRLEFGFTGVDSLGRYYDQPPYPHFGPALDETEPGFVEALGDAAEGRRRR